MPISTCINSPKSLSYAITQNDAFPSICSGIRNVHETIEVELVEGLLLARTATLTQPITLSNIQTEEWISVSLTNANQITVSTSQAFAPGEYIELSFLLTSAEGCKQRWVLKLQGREHSIPDNVLLSAIDGEPLLSPIDGSYLISAIPENSLYSAITGELLNSAINGNILTSAKP